jgi:hypothetical protein
MDSLSAWNTHLLPSRYQNADGVFTFPTGYLMRKKGVSSPPTTSIGNAALPFFALRFFRGWLSILKKR